MHRKPVHLNSLKKILITALDSPTENAIANIYYRRQWTTNLMSRPTLQLVKDVMLWDAPQRSWEQMWMKLGSYPKKTQVRLSRKQVAVLFWRGHYIPSSDPRTISDIKTLINICLLWKCIARIRLVFSVLEFFAVRLFRSTYLNTFRPKLRSSTRI